MQVVLHEDKKYYPTPEEVYRPEVEVSVIMACFMFVHQFVCQSYVMQLIMYCKSRNFLREFYFPK